MCTLAHLLCRWCLAEIAPNREVPSSPLASLERRERESLCELEGEEEGEEESGRRDIYTTDTPL